MRRALLALTAAGSIAVASVGTTTRAEARCWGCWGGAALAVGVIGGAIAASSAYGYGYGYGYAPAYYGYPTYASPSPYYGYGYYRPWRGYYGYGYRPYYGGYYVNRRAYYGGGYYRPWRGYYGGYRYGWRRW